MTWSRLLITSAVIAATVLGGSSFAASHNTNSKDLTGSNTQPTPVPFVAQNIVETNRPGNTKGSATTNAKVEQNGNNAHEFFNTDNKGNSYDTVHTNATNNHLKTTPPTPQTNTEDLRVCLEENDGCKPPVVLGMDEVPVATNAPSPDPTPSEIPPSPKPSIIPEPPVGCIKEGCIPPEDYCTPCPPGMRCPTLMPCVY